MSTLKARLLPPSRAALPGGYDFARDAFFAGVGAVGSTLGAIRLLPAAARRVLAPALPRCDRPGAQPPRAAGQRDHRRRRRRDRRGDGDGQARLPLQRRQGPYPRGRHFPHHHHFRRADDAGRRHLLRSSTRRLLALSPTLALRYPIKKWAAGVADGRLGLLRCRDRLAGRHRAGADHDADRARRGHPRPPRADHAQSRACRACRRRARARGDPRRQLPAFVRRCRGAGRGDGGAARGT